MLELRARSRTGAALKALLVTGGGGLALLAGLLLLGLLGAVFWLPAWWLAGRIDPEASKSPLRFAVSIGLALVAYITGAVLETLG